MTFPNSLVSITVFLYNLLDRHNLTKVGKFFNFIQHNSLNFITGGGMNVLVF